MMALTYITAQKIRNWCGAPQALVSDSIVETLGEEVERNTERWLNTKFIPTRRMETKDGSGTSMIFTNKNPLLTVRALKSNDNAVDVSELDISKPSGRIVLGTKNDSAVFVYKSKSVNIDYYYGLVEETSTTTTSSVATTAGTSVLVSVANTSGFVANNWVYIEGMDGNAEIAQINSVDSGALTITVDQLVMTHESGSMIVKHEIPQFIKTFMEVEAAFAVALYAIGSTYTFNASYSLGELSVTKGVPYTHWRETTDKLDKVRKEMRATIKPRPGIMVS